MKRTSENPYGLTDRQREIIQAYGDCNFNGTEAARHLGIDRQQVYQELRKIEVTEALRAEMLIRVWEWIAPYIHPQCGDNKGATKIVKRADGKLIHTFEPLKGIEILLKALGAIPLNKAEKDRNEWNGISGHLGPDPLIQALNAHARADWEGFLKKSAEEAEGEGDG